MNKKLVILVFTVIVYQSLVNATITCPANQNELKDKFHLSSGELHQKCNPYCEAGTWALRLGGLSIDKLTDEDKRRITECACYCKLYATDFPMAKESDKGKKYQRAFTTMEDASNKFKFDVK